MVQLRCTLLFSLLLLCCGLNAAWVVNQWGQQQGGPTNRVNDLVEGRNGFLWLATYEGLLRFDGSTYRTYNESDHPALLGGLFTVREAPDGALWMLSSSGYLIRLKDEQFTAWPAGTLVPRDPLAQISFTDNGKILLPLDSGFSTIDAEDRLVLMDLLELNDIRPVYNTVAADGALWVADANGGLWRYDGNRSEFFDLQQAGAPAGMVSGLRPFSDNRVYLAIAGRLGIFDPQLHELYLFPKEQFHEPNRIIRFSKGTSDSALIGSVNSPVYLVNNRQLTTIDVGGRAAQIILNSTDLRNGGYAIASYDRGLILLRPARVRPIAAQHGLQGKMINAIARIDDSQWLIGSEFGIELFNGTLAQPYRPANQPFSEYIHDIFVDSRQRLWIGTIGDGAFYMDPDSGEWRNINIADGLRSNSIRVFAEDNQGNILIGSTHGVDVWQDHEVIASYDSNNGLRNPLILSIYPDPNGNIWVGAAQGGLHRIRNGHVDSITGPSNPVAFESRPVFAMHADRNGDIWGGMAGGVFRIRGDSVRFIDVVPDLKLSSIFHVIDDGIDSFWITSASGLYQLPFEELHQSMDVGRFEVSNFRFYTRQDGLPSDAIRPNSRIWRSGSELWLPTEAGFFILNPQSLPPPLPTPVTLIDRVSHNDQQLPFLRAADQLFHTFEPGLRRLAVEFTSPYLGNSALVYHSVRLMGFEDHWRIVTNRQAEFTNLPPGDYALQVAARIDGNPMEGAPAVFQFTVKPHIYQTTWFRVLVALCAVAAFAFVIHSRTRSLRARQQELQSLVEERTSEIRASEALLSRNNELLRSLNEDKNEFLGIAAHDLRNPAAAIYSICDLLHHELDRRDCRDLDDLVESIRVSSANMMELISNLLDINKIEQGQMSADIQAVRIPELVAEVIDAHGSSIRTKDIQMRFERLSATNLVADADPALLRQVIDNLITNAIKYSPAGSKVLVECGEAESGWLRLSVKDQAGGIAEDEQQRLFTKFAKLSSKPTAGESSTGLGLSIAKRLTELMGGRIGCYSTLGKGSHFFVDLPRGSYSH